MNSKNLSLKGARAAVLLAALGYFVDIYDLVLFSIVRVSSLKSLGLEGDALFGSGVHLLNMQMGGMLIGGVLWGVLGDRKGRLSVLFGSIITYSLANIANAFVQSIEAYAWLRLIAGIGLAGELGAGITLVSETLPKHLRGYGTMIVATVGVSGAVLAGVIGESFDWRTAYLIGGGLGLMLLFLRIGVYESGMFAKIKNSDHSRGDFLSLFTSRKRLFRYLNCILVGVPIWYVIGILITFSPEFSKELGYVEEVSAGKAILFCYVGLILGDFSSGMLSQIFKSRKKALVLFLGITSFAVATFFSLRGLTAQGFYSLCVFLGLGVGYWAVFVTIAAEQFGTNLRSTVATTAPNFVRGSVVLVTSVFTYGKTQFGIWTSGMLVGGCVLAVAFLASVWLEETFHKDLDFVEPL